MHRSACVVAGVCILLGGAPLFSGEDKEARAIVTKGLEAIGGADNVAKQKAVLMKGSGTFYGLGEGIPYTGEWYWQGKDQMRFELQIKAGDKTLKLVQVVNGNMGWVKLNNETKAMPADELAEEQEGLYANWVTTLAPLKEPEFKLALVGEVKVEGKDAVGVRVSKKGKRDINLFFDKQSGLLVKTEHVIKDVKGGGDKEASQETIFQEYKEFGGVKHPTKVLLKRDGKPFVDATMSEIRPVESIDAALFGKP